METNNLRVRYTAVSLTAVTTKDFMQKNILDKRLSTAADFVPSGAVLADIGSDHALLPISLALNGKIKAGLASDINEGPVLAARKNICAYGVGDIVTAQRADGLYGVEKFSPDCITILGMGGELIVRIIDNAPWVKDSSIRLILQPMTHAEMLSRYLCDRGFNIVDDRIIRESERDDRIYRIMVAHFDAQARSLSDAEHFVGTKNLERLDEPTAAYIKRIINMFNTKKQGKMSGGHDCTYEDGIIRQLQSYIKDGDYENT